jgi:hypothetical protein
MAVNQSGWTWSHGRQREVLRDAEEHPLFQHFGQLLAATFKRVERQSKSKTHQPGLDFSR